MNNVENPWLWEEQKKLIAEAFTAWWKPRIIPWIRTYNLQQLPPSDGLKWLSAEHTAQLITAMNLELGQHCAPARMMLILGQSVARTEPSLSVAGTYLATIYCPVHHPAVITLLNFHREMAKAWSVYWYFPATGNRDCHQHIMRRAFYALLWTSSWLVTGGTEKNIWEIPSGSVPTSEGI